MNRITFGNRSLFSISVPTVVEGYYTDQIEFEINHRILTSSFCSIRYALPAMQEALSYKSPPPDCCELELAELSDENLFHELLYGGQLTNKQNSLREAYDSLQWSFGELLECHLIFCIPLMNGTRRLVWSRAHESRIEYNSLKRCSPVFGIKLPSEELFEPFEGLFEFFGARLDFDDDEWGQWGAQEHPKFGRSPDGATDS